MDALKKSLDDLKETFHYRMSEFQKDLQKGNSDSGSPSSRLASDFSVFRTFVMSSLECLQGQVNLLSRLTDQIESRSRRKIVLLHGVPEAKKENTGTLIVGELKKHFSLPELVPESLTQCHRMGQMKSGKHRPILLKCRDLSLKSKLWQNKKQLKGTGITMSEFLTKPRHDAFMAGRKKFGIGKCWTMDGTVYVLDAAETRHKVFSVGDLDSIPGGDTASTGDSDTIPSRVDTTPRSVTASSSEVDTTPGGITAGPASSPTIETAPKQRPKRAVRNK